MLGLWMAVRELRNIARRLGPVQPRSQALSLPSGDMPRLTPPKRAFSRPAADQPVRPRRAGAAPSVPPPPWQDEDVLRDHPIPEPMFPEDTVPPPPPAAKPKRNLLFSSTSRKERERAQARTGEPLPPDCCRRFVALTARDRTGRAATRVVRRRLAETGTREARRSAVAAAPRTPSTFDEANAAPARNEDQPAVTVLKSGVVDGMAYSLYSDGSIEAQMPEGMMRFASIDELRAHLDQRA